MADDPAADPRDDRIRILEFQVDHLRRELELLEKRHAEAIYSVAWHVGWPVRIVERAIRKLFSRRTGDETTMASGVPDAPPQPPKTPGRDDISARIARRM